MVGRGLQSAHSDSRNDPPGVAPTGAAADEAEESAAEQPPRKRRALAPAPAAESDSDSDTADDSGQPEETKASTPAKAGKADSQNSNPSSSKKKGGNKSSELQAASLDQLPDKIVKPLDLMKAKLCFKQAADDKLSTFQV